MRNSTVFLLLLYVVTYLSPANSFKLKKSQLIGVGAGFLLSIQPTIASSVFEGKYSDPINHPGGTRTISVIGDKVGGYQLAKVNGGGGRGAQGAQVVWLVLLLLFPLPRAPRERRGLLQRVPAAQRPADAAARASGGASEGPTMSSP